MPSLKLVFFAIQALLIGFFLRQSPYMMASQAPTKPWADGPMNLITTPTYATKKVQELSGTVKENRKVTS